jgi:hypothetical protein
MSLISSWCRRVLFSVVNVVNKNAVTKESSMFTAAGSIMVKIDDVKFAEPKFAKGPNDFDICIHGTSIADANQGDYWRGEMSQNYGKGNYASMTQAQITMKTLRQLGFEGEDLSTLPEQIVGKQVPFAVVASEPNDQGKVFYNVRYIDIGQGISEIDTETMKAKVAALFSGGAATAPTPSTAPAGNPFAKKTPVGEKKAPATGGAKLPF